MGLTIVRSGTNIKQRVGLTIAKAGTNNGKVWD